MPKRPPAPIARPRRAEAEGVGAAVAPAAPASKAAKRLALLLLAGVLAFNFPVLAAAERLGDALPGGFVVYLFAAWAGLIAAACALNLRHGSG